VPPQRVTAPAAALLLSEPAQAIKEIRGNNKVLDQDPEGKYEALTKYARDLTQVRACPCVRMRVFACVRVRALLPAAGSASGLHA